MSVLSIHQPTWWSESDRADPASVKIADRHYNRQTPGSPQFVPPGRCYVLRHATDALWVTSWPYAEFVRIRAAPSAPALELRIERDDFGVMLPAGRGAKCHTAVTCFTPKP